ncbi:MAG TPA: zinc-binding dehydrogenase, partial [Candidatus Baltobacteraceae bacterium]|nr:zinc-binding dehydrogenase [Candidatus Baltobacteraceae bacterium]
LLFAKHVGARAIVTSGSEEKLARAKEFGADEGLNYRTVPDWHKALRAMGSIDLVVDSSGGDTLAKAIDAVRPGGRIAVYGGTNLDATIKMFPLFWKHVTIAGTSMGSPQDFDAMLELFEEGDLHPVIDQIFAMKDVAEAAQRMASSNQFGKIVLDID